MTGWQHAGQVTLSTAGDLVFPAAGNSPGLYRFTITGGPEVAVYIGQAGGRRGLQGRFRQYRRSARRAADGRLTTRRNAPYLRAALEAGHSVRVDLIPGIDDKATRDALELARIAELSRVPGIRVLNRAGVVRRDAFEHGR